MKKYKQNRKLIEINCDNCKQLFEKPVSEFNRNVRLGRNNYCSRSCAGKSSTNLINLKKMRENQEPSPNFIRYGDEFVGFRYYLRNIKSRFKDYDVTLQDLKDQWDKQSGICPYTNFKLQLKKGFNDNIPFHLQASIDRIDSNEGYVKNNIEFISLPINYFKSNQLTKTETIRILKEIATNFH